MKQPWLYEHIWLPDPAREDYNSTLKHTSVFQFIHFNSFSFNYMIKSKFE